MMLSAQKYLITAPRFYGQLLWFFLFSEKPGYQRLVLLELVQTSVVRFTAKTRAQYKVNRSQNNHQRLIQSAYVRLIDL